MARNAEQRYEDAYNMSEWEADARAEFEHETSEGITDMDWEEWMRTALEGPDEPPEPIEPDYNDAW